MKLLRSTFILLSVSNSIQAFLSPKAHTIHRHMSSLSMSSSAEMVRFVQGPRIVRDELPIVYVYDHCPFCVRVRLALGIKNIKHTVHFLANDDVKTPTKLVGKKIAPIFVSFLSYCCETLIF
jgi:hypothetical protein